MHHSTGIPLTSVFHVGRTCNQCKMLTRARTFEQRQSQMVYIFIIHQANVIKKGDYVRGMILFA